MAVVFSLISLELSCQWQMLFTATGRSLRTLMEDSRGVLIIP